MPVANRIPAVVITGLAGIIFTLILVWILRENGINVMDFWLGKNGSRYVPLGAILAGLVAGGGAWAVARWTNTKIQDRYAWLLVAAGVLGSVAFLYAEFTFSASPHAQAATFGGYLESLCVAEARPGLTGDVSIWEGYVAFFARWLCFAGCAGAGLFCAARMQWCTRCSGYMKHIASGSISFGPTVKEVRATPNPERNESLAHLKNELGDLAGDWKDRLRSTSTHDLRAQIKAYPEMPDERASATLRVLLHQCRNCGDRHLQLIHLLLNPDSKLDNTSPNVLFKETDSASEPEQSQQRSSVAEELIRKRGQVA